MNYHQGMSSAELHIKVILQWVSQTGNCPLNPPLPEFSEIRRQKGSEAISRFYFIFFVTFGIGSGIGGTMQKSKGLS